MLLTVTDSGFGKRTSAYEYRVTGRGGQGIAQHHPGATERHGRWRRPSRCATGDDVMLVTDAGRLIRVPADQVRITGRQAMGVTLFRRGRGRARDQRASRSWRTRPTKAGRRMRSPPLRKDTMADSKAP